MTPKDDPNTDLFRLVVGERLVAVIFSSGFVQLDFNGPMLTAFNALSVRLNGSSWNEDGDGWRDALCARIGCQVLKATDSEAELAFVFDDGSEIALSLREEDTEGPHAFLFRAGEGPWVEG